MKSPWPQIALGEILHKSNDWITLHPERIYREITVKLWGNGVILRREVLGAEIASDRRLKVKPGQFIVSRIDARNGAFGLIPDELDGGVVTNDFPVFEPDKSRLHTPYLGWMSKTATFVDLCKAASEGTTNRVRLKEHTFLSMAIHLPPLKEQQRITARIEELVPRIKHAIHLRRSSFAETIKIVSARASWIFDEVARKNSPKQLGSFNPQVTSGPRNWSKYISDAGLRFYRAQDIGADGKLATSGKCHIQPPNDGQGAMARLRVGDLMIIITGATVGRCAVYPDGIDPGYVSQHVAICRFESTEILPEYVWWGLLSPMGHEQLLGKRYGQGKPGLNLTNLRSIALPFPSISEQRRIAAYLKEVAATADSLTRFQESTAAELKALHSSVLDRAFNGGL